MSSIAWVEFNGLKENMSRRRKKKKEHAGEIEQIEQESKVDAGGHLVLRSCGVHDGEFHADEIVACALLIRANLIDERSIIRTRDPLVLEKCEFVCDVGGEFDFEKKRFDHHQISYKGHLSSAGMVLSYLCCNQILSGVFCHYLERVLVRGVDEIDNGIMPPIYGLCTFSGVVAAFVPCDRSNVDDLNKAFYEALHFALAHLAREERRFLYVQKFKSIVKKVMERDRECLIFDQPIPWRESFFEMNGEAHSAEFIIMPYGKYWQLRCIPPTYARSMEVRVPLPETWAGLLSKDLQEATGISGAIFCHKGLFISFWETKEDALKALRIVTSFKKKQE